MGLLHPPATLVCFLKSRGASEEPLQAREKLNTVQPGRCFRVPQFTLNLQSW